MTHDKATVYLGLGSNLGHRKENLDRALTALDRLLKGKRMGCSSFLETEPWGFVSSHAFLNAVAVYATPLTPRKLLHVTQAVERWLGRTAKSREGIYSDRPIDIDLLLYYDAEGKAVNLCEDDLTLPHPLMHRRLFVLEPLCRVAPTLLHPTLGRTMQSLLEELRKEEEENK